MNYLLYAYDEMHLVYIYKWPNFEVISVAVDSDKAHVFRCHVFGWPASASYLLGTGRKPRGMDGGYSNKFLYFADE